MKNTKSAQSKKTLSEGARYKIVFDLLEKDGEVLTNDLAERFGMSYATWHRDLQKLANEKKLSQTTGGAIKLLPSISQLNETSFPVSDVSPAVGRVVAQITAPGRAIILDGSPHTIQMSRHLPNDLRSTVITNSPQVATVLAGRPHIEIIMSGGRLRASSLIPRDSGGYDYIRKVNADLCVLGSCRVHHEKGITVSDFDELTIKEAMIESASKVALLATADTLNNEHQFRVAEFNKLTHLILIDNNIPDEALKHYQDRGIEIIRA